MILGTAGYMSPEQARGKQVDKRADIWAFGVVLYEMLTGKKLFTGEEVVDILAAIVKSEPDIRAAPPQFHKLLTACLQKDPKQRLQTAGDWKLLLDSGTGSQPTAVSQTVPASRFGTIAVAAAAFFAVVAGALAFFHFREKSPEQQSLRLQTTLPGNVATRDIALSPDGRYLAFVSGTAGPGQLWVRPMDSIEARMLPGAEAVTYPFWSPDSAYIGFFSQGKLKKIGIAGGPPQTLCDVATARGGTWNRDGVILFSPGPTSPIYRVSASGGIPVAVTKLASAGEGHRFPVFLPDGNHFLFHVGSVSAERTGVFVSSMNGDTPIRLLPGNTNASFAPSSMRAGEGYILFRRDDALMAQPFDATRLKATGDASPIAERVPTGPNTGYGVFTVSENGLLALRLGDQADRQLVWFDRNGKRGSVVAKDAMVFGFPSFSPDGNVLAEGLGTLSQRDIWLVDLVRGVRTRFSFRSGMARAPVWSPDGSRIAYGYTATNGYNYDTVLKSANGTGQEDVLISGGVNTWPVDWSPDGKFLLIQQTGQNTAIDLLLLPMEAPPQSGPRKLIPFAQTPFDETGGRFSPDGKWIAYVSNESGQNQVYLQAFPSTGTKYQVSTTGGSGPHWRRDGKEIYYLSADAKVMAVPVKLGVSVELGMPQVLFTDTGMSGAIPTHDGQRFLVNLPAGDETAAALLTVITNWQARLKK